MSQNNTTKPKELTKAEIEAIKKAKEKMVKGNKIVTKW